MNGGALPAIAFREVTRTFDGRAVLNNLSFEVAPGEAFCLLGRSGMGKSVTLKHLGQSVFAHPDNVVVFNADCSCIRLY